MQRRGQHTFFQSFLFLELALSGGRIDGSFAVFSHLRENGKRDEKEGNLENEENVLSLSAVLMISSRTTVSRKLLCLIRCHVITQSWYHQLLSAHPGIKLLES